MKTSITESLALSYLKHVKQCVQYQSDWRPSNSWERFNIEIVHSIFGFIQDPDYSVEQYFKHTTLKEFLEHASISALGTDQGGKVYAVELFHLEAELTDGGMNATIEHIIKRVVGIYLLLLSYFPSRDYEIIFACPKVEPELEKDFRSAMRTLEYFFRNQFSELSFYGNEVDFRFFHNDYFRKVILEEVIFKGEEHSHTSEVQAIQAFDHLAPPTSKKGATELDEEDEEDGDEYEDEDFLQGVELEFHPADEQLFKQKLDCSRRALRTWRYDDGRVIHDVWDATTVPAIIDLRAYILCNPKILAHEETGLYALELRVIE